MHSPFVNFLYHLSFLLFGQQSIGVTREETTNFKSVSFGFVSLNWTQTKGHDTQEPGPVPHLHLFLVDFDSPSRHRPQPCLLCLLFPYLEQSILLLFIECLVPSILRNHGSEEETRFLLYPDTISMSMLFTIISSNTYLILKRKNALYKPLSLNFNGLLE